MNVFLDYRSRRGLSQAELAKRLGVQQSTISHYETARRVPGLAVVQRFLALAAQDDFPVTLEDILLRRERSTEDAA